MKSIIRKIILKAIRYKKEDPSYILNINYNPLQQQKRILLCYMTDPLILDLEKGKVFHPNRIREIIMIKALINLDYCIDICNCTDLSSLLLLKQRNYHLIFGFGPVYEALVYNNNITPHCLYITENDPTTISEKYKERCKYFKQRHPNLKLVKSQRTTFYTKQQFELSETALIMTNRHNAQTMLPYFKKFQWIYVNGIKNTNFKIERKEPTSTRKNFLWFGSTGLIQKGLDIIVDVFRLIPELHLTICGASPQELSYIKSIIPSNVSIIKNKVNIQSTSFLELMYNHTFIISASCMEGMQSGIATCMMHGLIPIITQECGYHPNESIIEITDYHIDYIVTKLKSIIEWEDKKIDYMSTQAYDYANKTFTLDAFYKTFYSFIKNYNTI